VATDDRLGVRDILESLLLRMKLLEKFGCSQLQTDELRMYYDHFTCIYLSFWLRSQWMGPLTKTLKYYGRDEYRKGNLVIHSTFPRLPIDYLFTFKNKYYRASLIRISQVIDEYL